MKLLSMKRISTLALLVVFMISILLCSCGKNEPSNSNQSNNNSLTESTGEPSDSHTSVDDNVLTSTYKVPLKNIYIDVPDYHFISDGYTVIYLEDGVKYFAISYDTSLSSSNLKKTFETIFSGFKADMGGYHHINELNNVEEQTVSINGIDFLKCKGSINCGENPTYDAYMISYTFALDNTSCTVFGVVMDEAQKEPEISDVNTIVEEMVKTVRDYQ